MRFRASNKRWISALAAAVMVCVCVTASAQSYRLGDEADEIATIQTALKQLKLYSAGITGHYGEKTETAVKKFQKKYALEDNGVVDEATRAALYEAAGITYIAGSSSSSGASSSNSSVSSSGGTTLRYDMRSDAVLKLQQDLSKLGYYSGKISGHFGSKTESAVMSFQKANGLSADGIAGSKTLAKIATALGITAAAFGRRSLRRLLTAACWYAALNIALAGVVMLVMLNTGARWLDAANLTVYLHISPLLLLGLCGGCCAAVELGLRLLSRREPPVKTAGLEFELCGQLVRLRAALDTGCHLQDPLTCLPVLVVSYPDARARLPAAADAFLAQWFAGQDHAEPPPGTRLRLVPCGTAAEKGLLPGFAVQGISLITEKGVLGLGRSAVVFAPRSFGSTDYEALYGSDFM